MNIRRWKGFALWATLAGCAGCGGPPFDRAPEGSGRADVRHAQDVPASLSRNSRKAPVYSTDVAPIFESYCVHCHDAGSAEGGVVLDALARRGREHGRGDLLARVADSLRSESMPPEGEPRPSPIELEALNAWLSSEETADRPRGPRVATRRLNRSEYNNTIRDLLGLDLRLADEFPADDVGYGFDNIADVLATPPILVEMYHSAAERAVAAAFDSAEARRRILEPPPDTTPLVFRRYTPPTRSSREAKVLRTSEAQAVDVQLAHEQRVYDILRGFADRAYRRPATHEELIRLFGIVTSAEKDGEDQDSALRLGLVAVLSSPHFLFLGPGAGLDTEATPGLIPEQDFELASRLSYFLWRSMPDEELLRRAGQGMLRRGEVLESQVRRMLGDPRSQALAEDFAGQWLQLRRLRDFAPDRAIFPDFDEPLRAAMLEESTRLFRSIQEEDRSIIDLLEADYSFVNERLARHYGLPGVRGEEFRRVSLKRTHRGGILTHASVLMTTSNPTRTSPVKRGKWILENILGTPPAPPPTGVEAIAEAEGDAHGTTFRERLLRHAKDRTCAACHGRMDPLGFTLENFDVIGAWRDRDGGKPIDATGRLPGGKELGGSGALMVALAARRRAFAGCLADKMLTYARGRGLDPDERGAVDRVVEGLERGGYRFSSLVMGVVQSHAFQYRRGERVGP